MTEPEFGQVSREEAVYDPSHGEDAEVSSTVRYVISSYGADYPVDGLVKRLNQSDIYVPEFQRGFVWTHAQASRFVESMLLGLPVPGIFLFRDPDQKLVVVDGQQRLRSLQKFYEGLIHGREFALRGVSEGLNGLTYKTLPDEDRRRLDDSILHATIFQQDDPRDDRTSVYLVFERLNTGGTPLVAQEIRSCVYPGALNDLLKGLSNHPKWREIFGPPSPRGKDQELILRFLALYYDGNSYERPLKGFLNDFMQKNRQPSAQRLEEMQKVFDRAVTVAANSLTRSAFRPERNLNAAVADALLVGLARRLSEGLIANTDGLRDAAKSLWDNKQFKDSVMSGTTDVSSVSNRLRIATSAFSKVQ